MLITACLSLLSGLVIGTYGAHAISFWLLGLFYFTWLVWFFRRSLRPKGWIKVIAVSLAVVAMGWLGFARSVELNNQQALAARALEYDTQQVLRGVILPFPEKRPSGWRFRVKISYPEDYRGYKILVYGALRPVPKAGRTIEFVGLIKKPDRIGDFDWAAHLARQGVFGVVFYPEFFRPDLTSGSKFWAGLDELRSHLRKFAGQHLYFPAENFFNSFVLGERTSFSNEFWDLLRRSGTVHLVAISGLHIMIILGGLFFLLTRFIDRRAGLVLSLLATLSYVFFVGAPTSALRAFLMALVLIPSIGFWQPLRILSAALLAATLILLISPFSFRYDLGFQFSFTAIIGIAGLTPLIEHLLRKFGRGSILKKALAISTAAFLATLPLSLYHFGLAAWLSPLVNVVLIPTLPLLLILSWAVALSSLASPALAAIPAILLAGVSDLIINALKLISTQGLIVVEDFKISAAGAIFWLAVLGVVIALWEIYWRRNLSPAAQLRQGKILIDGGGKTLFKYEKT